MGQFSVEISLNAGSVLSGNQQRLAIEATSFLDQDKNIERVREVIVDLVLKIEIETILGGPAGELRARLHKILDVIVAKRGY